MGTGYILIRKSAAESTTVQDFWAQNPTYKVAHDQLLSGLNNAATAGSVIGNYVQVRDAVREGENSMFLNGTAEQGGCRRCAEGHHGDRGLQRACRSRLAAISRREQALRVVDQHRLDVGVGDPRSSSIGTKSVTRYV